MLVYLELLHRGIANSSLKIEALRKSFLSAIGPLPHIQPQVFLLCEAVHRIIAIAASLIIKPRHVFEYWERTASVRENIRWFCNSIQPSLWIE
jgi:hypothetical protein